ncbi:hypothetical protein PENSPDRAFT_644311 [Peniophora sp. CONT]|nr:hypothetical protein PENSPDRAFT_644311 [Peniophora sp. CONT]
MDPMDYPDYEPTYADLGIDPNNPNEGYYSSDDGESGPGDSATGSDYAETEEYDSDYSEEDIFELESQRYCPDWDHLPWENSLNTRFWTNKHGYYGPSHHWAFVGEIIENLTLLRPSFLLRDREGKEVFIIFYLDNGTQANFKDFRVGRTVVLYYAEKRQFVDGQVGIRIEEMSRAKAIPCTLDTLMKADSEAAAASSSCAKCDKSSTTLSSCSACKTRYCSRDCQVSAWKAHKPQCAVLKQVREWNERDWHDFDEYWY